VKVIENFQCEKFKFFSLFHLFFSCSGKIFFALLQIVEHFSSLSHTLDVAKKIGVLMHKIPRNCYRTEDFVLTVKK
jgi:hypothetical protein